MRSMRRFLLGIGLLLAACGPGPVPAGKSRILVECVGMSLSSTPISILETTSQFQVDSKTLSCFFYQAITFDLYVPPNLYDVLAGSRLIETVHFDGTGEQHTISGWSVVVGYSFST